jgi:endonuclease-3
MLVGFGQVICLPVGPRCDICLLAKEKLCPSAVRNVNSKGRKLVSVDFTSETAPKLEIEYEGLQSVDDVLEVVDQVDGVVDIGEAKKEVKVEDMF